jgi:predicted nuclease of predicted toxin-antitoxin system
VKFLANENIPLASVAKLRESGHDIVSVSELSPGISDEQVLRIAHNEQRTIITFDADYGELVFLHRQPAPAGIIYLRFVPGFPSEPADFVARVISNQKITVERHFVVVNRSTVRMRPLAQ